MTDSLAPVTGEKMSIFVLFSIVLEVLARKIKDITDWKGLNIFIHKKVVYTENLKESTETSENKWIYSDIKLMNKIYGLKRNNEKTKFQTMSFRITLKKWKRVVEFVLQKIKFHGIFTRYDLLSPGGMFYFSIHLK